MRASVVSPALVVLGLLSACPSSRTAGGDGDGGGGGARLDVCDVEGLEVFVPEDDASVAEGAPPDLSCIGNPVQVAAPTDLTLEGCVDIFGVGDKARAGTEIAIFAADEDPKTGTPLVTGTVAVASARSQLRGTCSRTESECGPTRSCVDRTARDCDEDADCPAGRTCGEDGTCQVRDEGFCDCTTGPDANEPACRALDCGSEGFYRLDTPLPSHTPLTMRMTHASDTSVIDTYVWGLVLLEDGAVEGVYTYAAPLIYDSTYRSIPTLSGRQMDGREDLHDGVGRGVVAGEIHDCTDTVVGNAVVGMTDYDRSTMTIAYFDGDANDPKPDTRRLSTAADGLYAILNVTPDVEHTIVAGTRDPACSGDDCTCLSLGSRTVKAYADSVSIVTLRGDFPVHQ